jgi:hypothetical protein
MRLKKILNFVLIFCIFALPIKAFGFSDGLMFGANHNYTVIFRGNGEAIVYGKLVISNSEEEDLTNYKIDLKNVKFAEFSAFQKILKPVCVDYNYIKEERNCLKYKEPDYNQDYGYFYNEDPEYKKIKTTIKNGEINFELPEPIKSLKSGMIIFSYSSKSYTTQKIGLFTYNFQTPSTDLRIKEATVAVDVDSDLYLKGKKSSINYGRDSTKELAPVASIDGSVSSKNLDRIASSIGNGPIVKTGKNIAPTESLIVKGQYAKSWARLNLMIITVMGVFLGSILTGSFFWGRSLKRKNEKKSHEETEGINVKSDIHPFDIKIVSSGLLSALSITAIAYLVSILQSSHFFYGEIMGILFTIMIFIIIALAAFGPAVVMGIKYGWKAALYVLLFELLWLGLILMFYIFLERRQEYINYPSRPTNF